MYKYVYNQSIDFTSEYTAPYLTKHGATKFIHYMHITYRHGPLVQKRLTLMICSLLSLSAIQQVFDIYICTVPCAWARKYWYHWGNMHTVGILLCLVVVKRYSILPISVLFTSHAIITGFSCTNDTTLTNMGFLNHMNPFVVSDKTTTKHSINKRFVCLIWCTCSLGVVVYI